MHSSLNAFEIMFFISCIFFDFSGPTYDDVLHNFCDFCAILP